MTGVDVAPKLGFKHYLKHLGKAAKKAHLREQAKATIPKIFRDGEMIFLLCDQDAGRDGIFVPFFDRLASTPGGPALYSIRYGVPILYVISFFPLMSGSFSGKTPKLKGSIYLLNLLSGLTIDLENLKNKTMKITAIKPIKKNILRTARFSVISLLLFTVL